MASKTNPKRLLGLSWALSGLSWAVLGLSWGFLGLSWGSLGLSWGCLVLSWAFLGLSWAVSGFLGAVLGLLELLREPTPLKNYCSRLFSGSWTGKTSIHWVAASSQSNRQPATCGQEARPVSRKRVDPAALPLGSQRSRTQIAFSRWRRLALAEIHGVESPKPGCRNRVFRILHHSRAKCSFFAQMAFRSAGRGGGFAACRAGPVACQGGLKTIKNVKLSQFSASQPQSVRPLSHFRVFQLQDCPRWPQVAQDSPSCPKMCPKMRPTMAQDCLK